MPSARLVAKAIADGALGVHEPEPHVVLLLDEQATAERVRSEMHAIQQAGEFRENDLFLLYFTGWAGFGCWDWTGEDTPAHNGEASGPGSLSIADMVQELDAIPIRHQILVLDVRCEPATIERLAIQTMKSGTSGRRGVIAVGACLLDSPVSPLATAVASALGGEGDVGPDPDGIVSAWEFCASITRLNMEQEGRTFRKGGWCPLHVRIPDWDQPLSAASGHPTRTYAGAGGTVRGLAISPDGSRLAVARDTAVGVWNLADGTRVNRLVDEQFLGASRIAFRPDGEVLHSEYVEGEFNDLSADGKLIVAVSKEGEASVWSAVDRSRLVRLERQVPPASCASFAPGGDWVVTGHIDGAVRRWDARTGKAVDLLGKHEAGVLCVCVSKDGTTVLTGGRDAVARLWSVRGGSGIVLPTNQFAVTSVALSPSGLEALTGGEDRTARLWDVASRSEVLRLKGHAGAVTSVAFTPDGKAVLTGSRDGVVRMWDLEEARARFAGGGAEGDVRGLRTAPATPDRSETSIAAARVDRALLVATSRYADAEAWPHLENPVRDAETLKRELEESFGFRADVMRDPELGDVYRALKKLQSDTYGPDDQLLRFFAGHGLFDEVTQEGFLITRDSGPGPNPQPAMPCSQLQRAVDKIPCRHVLVMLDSCFSGAFDGALGQAGDRGGASSATLPVEQIVQQKLKHRARLFLTSGGKEYVPDKSAFLSKVLERLRDVAGYGRLVTWSDLKAGLVGIAPEPRAGTFGQNESGADFLFVRRSGRAPPR